MCPTKILKLPRLFGGGTKKLLRTASVSTSGPPSATGQQSVTATPTEEGSGPANWLSKQRGKLNFKILGHQPSVMKEDKPTYREQFVPPEMSMLAYLLTKVILHTFLFVKLQRKNFSSLMYERSFLKMRAIQKAKTRMCLTVQ